MIFIDDKSDFRRGDWQIRLSMYGAVLLSGAGLSTVFTKALANSGEKAKKETQAPFDTAWVPWVAFVLALLLIGALILFLITRRQYMANENKGFAAKLKAQAKYHEEALEKLRKTTELATLMELNQGQINEYHRIVTDQADKAFRSSRTAMWVGLALLVAAAIGGAKVPVEEMRWFLAALAAFSTLLSGYLSRTYMVLYRESISQLNRYFDQPVLNSYFLTAERLTDGLDVEHAQRVRQQIVDEVLASSSRLTGKPAADPPAVDDAKPKKRKPKKRIPRQAQTSVNDHPPSRT
ncbi:hypothetical protein [Streptomyces sp. NBC_00687]|uniref:hypothetical protein n=1 Tax=Streptomyces sp. NBC_00687 TaxID=2975807 RepID=UPI002258F26F|nr:hypothetical protein [Streptomyces sp. NBC_00687]MCX4912838.1 hypothetical protein [Streptomyces sp. NBC_00687]